MRRTKRPEIEKNSWGLPDIGIPAEVLFHPKLSCMEKILFGFIRNLSRSERGCWASNNWLGGLLGVKGQTISNAVAKLKYYELIEVGYLQLGDGKQVRRIFINPEYPAIYERMLTETYKNINKGVLQKLYPSITKIITPYNKSHNKEDKEIDNKKDKENKSILSKDFSKEKNLSSKKKQSIQKRNQNFSPLAEKLAKIVQSNKNIKVTKPQIKTWSNEIRKLSEMKEVHINRIENALDWYADNIGGEFIPVIESGASLNNKFTQLEDAMKRDKGSSFNPKQTPNIDPHELIKEEFKSKDMIKIFTKNCYKPARDLLDDVDEGELANTLIDFYLEVKKRQDKNLPKNLRGVLPGPIDIIAGYIKWVEKNHWIKHKSTKIFDIGHTLFGRFRRDQASTDNMERDSITGKTHMK